MLGKSYDHRPIEERLYRRWVKEGLFNSSPGEERGPEPPFVIVIPPPNITGSLHMGHAVNATLQDVLVRFYRMRGREVCWVPGMDHAGIAAQNVVEKILKSEGRTRHDLGRENFLERMWTWRREVGDTILMQFRRLGCALDWSRKRFTMEEPCLSAVYAAFQKLWEKGLIYRGSRMINWCVRCGTALSDIEVEHEEENSHLWYIHYPREDGGRGIVVATTRPETMLGDTAVAVPPGSERWKAFVGKRVSLPLTGRAIPVVEDEAVDPEFGMGAVKVTPSHDPNDFEISLRHDIGRVAVIDFSGRMTKSAGKRYEGLSREECRKKVLEDLKAENLLEKIEDYRHAVPVCYRCEQVVEPLISEQWFLRMKDLAEPAIRSITEGNVKYFPQSWMQPSLDWLKNIKDWCISRQIWWGHQIPIWYCGRCDGDQILIPDGSPASGSPAKLGGSQVTYARWRNSGRSYEDALANQDRMRVLSPSNAIFGISRPEKCPKCKGRELFKDQDVLDTWFSSALWPFSVLGWPEATKDLKFYYPTSVLVTAYEILYLWVARMIMTGLEFMGDIPFEHVYVHGMVRDVRGKKMSKSLGNVIDPLSMMDKYGTDAMRFTLISQSVPGRDIQFSEESIIGPRNFANKIWNSSRFVFMNLSDKTEPPEWREEDMDLADRWILGEYHKVVEATDRLIREYNLSQAALGLYDFLWDKFCDWYIELAKIGLQAGAGDETLIRGAVPGSDAARRRAAQAVLIEVLSGTLKLLHPFMPFITEELWQALRSCAREKVGAPEVRDETLIRGAVPAGGLLRQKAPEFDARWISREVQDDMAVVMSVITAIRGIRSHFGVPPGMQIPAICISKDAHARGVLTKHGSYVTRLARVKKIDVLAGGEKPPKCASAVVPGVLVYVPLGGIIDIEKERKRLGKEMTAVAGDLERAEKKLSNQNFLSRAPQSEVEKVRTRKEHLLQKYEQTKKHLAEIA